jgi:hypothetical protein
LFSPDSKIIPFFKMEIFHILRSDTGLEGLTVFHQGFDYMEGQLTLPAGLVPAILAGMMEGIVRLVFIGAFFFHNTTFLN